MKKTWCVLMAVSSLAAAPAAELVVGPGRAFARIEEAVKAAQPGDVVLVHPAAGGAYAKVAVWLDTPHVTIRGAAGAGRRVVLDGAGFDYSGRGYVPRALFQFNRGAEGCVLEGFELRGAHNGSHNGAGVRINQACNVTIRDCDIHHNDMGVMSNGDGTLDRATNQLIEACAIHHNGDKTEPGYNHNLYLGGADVTLRACDIHSSLTGHNVKSRAHRIAIRDCRIHDSENRELDLVDAAETGFPGSDALLTGNVIAKGLACRGNRGVIHFGQDGGRPRLGTLRLEGNTISTPFVTPVVQLSSPQTRVELVNNAFVNSGKAAAAQRLVDAKASTEERPVTGRGNRVAASFSGAAGEEPGLTDTIVTDAPAGK